VTDDRAPSLRRMPGRASVVTGSVAVFGMVVSALLAAVVVAGFLQWGPAWSPLVDNGLPLLVLVLGLALAGRVAVDVSGRHAVLAALGATALVGLVGLFLARTSDAHGDGIEPVQVLEACAVVLAVVGLTAWLVVRRRTRRLA
jgi:hypothetical protein